MQNRYISAIGQENAKEIFDLITVMFRKHSVHEYEYLGMFRALRSDFYAPTFTFGLLLPSAKVFVHLGKKLIH